MRKDVKFGLTIGGILVVTLVIYVIVLSRGPGVPQKMGITLQQPGDQSAATADANSPGAKDSAKTDSDQTADANAPLNDSSNTTQTPTDTAISPTPATQPTASAGTSDWDNALNHGLPPALSAPQHTVTPTIDSTSTTVARTDVDRRSSVPMIDSPATTQPTRTFAAAPLTSSAPTIDSVPSPLYASAAPTAPTFEPTIPMAEPAPAAPSTPRTHRVESGESPYSIAQTIYGNGKYYKQILAANPKIDPHHLRIGQILVIPELREADKAPAANSARATPSTVIDPSSQYTVESGDTLESICRRLYGGPSMIEKLYEANKSLIGPDENRLKIGWVLKLPQAPNQSNSDSGPRAN